MVQAVASKPPLESPAPGKAVLRYTISGFSEHWIIPEVPVPESAWHDRCLELVKALLDAWVAAGQRDAAVFRDLAILAQREKPRVGFNPDVCVVEPAPPGSAVLESLRLWEHTVPRFCFEAVSPHHPFKDYAVIPEKCAVTGVEELAVFDPLLAGRRIQGGPWLLQLWQRAADGAFERVYAGDGAAYSRVLGGWLQPDREARRLRVAAEPNGAGRWLTAEEAARNAEAAAREREAAAREREAAARTGEAAALERAEAARDREEAALRRIAELEAALRGK